MAFPEPKPRGAELPRKLLKTLDCGQGAVRAVRFNVDGNYCLTCGSDKTLKLWNPLRGTLLRTYSGHGYEVLDAAGSFDNSNLCSGGGDKAVVLWDVASGLVVRKFRGHAGKVNTVQFNEEATLILSGSIDSSIRCWDCRSRRPEPVQTLDEARDGISSVKVSDHEVLAGSVDGRVRRYDLRKGQLFSDYVGSPITCTCFSRDGQCTLVSSLDSTLRLLDKDTGELLGEYSGHQNKQYKLDCCLSERDTHVVSCSEDGKVFFWDLVEPLPCLRRVTLGLDLGARRRARMRQEGIADKGAARSGSGRQALERRQQNPVRRGERQAGLLAWPWARGASSSVRPERNEFRSPELPPAVVPTPGLSWMCPSLREAQGSLALALPVGAGVVQSLAFHPSEPCLLTATGGRIQCWREEAYEAGGGAG
ncbi:WD repeat domain-containing protein 83 [Sciurus carolinensis]|uniref:WD repeat domain-containing protein 83 n=1 Tax=Sciurus carolinensis TaxID=30640 RepID=A0AA41MPJ4_SCICA|nr:WD repeat domain-containing protein 83 [Sciurus carolinensis]